MSRNRTIYQSEAVYVGPSPATGNHFSPGAYGDGSFGPISGSLVKELLRVQSANYGFNIPRTDVNQFNQLAAISQESINEPTVSLDISYLLASLYNERVLGLHISSGTMVSCLSGLLTKATDEKNYFIRTVSEGLDAVTIAGSPTTAGGNCLGLGNCYISSYSTEGSVGSIPTASVRLEGANIGFFNYTSGLIPAIDPSNGAEISNKYFMLPHALTNPTGVLGTEITTTVLKPGDVVMDFGTFANAGADFTDLKVQNYSVSFDLARDPLRKLGTKFPFSREPRFPVQATMSVTADLGDIATGSLTQLFADTGRYNVGVKIYSPDTTVANRNDSNVAAYFQLRGARLESENFSSSIGANKSVTFNFTAQVGGPQQTNLGVFMSGKYY